MNRVLPRHGDSGPPGDRSRLFISSFRFQRCRRGFTLLEMLMVLLIFAILAGLSVPAIQTAFTEQAVRRDSHQLALMVKTAMIQSSEQHRIYVIDLTSTTMALHPAGEAPADPDASTDDDDATASDSATHNVEVTSELDPLNRLVIPDPQKPNAWIDVDGTQWVFQPGELCSVPRVRLTRGDAWLEMSFNVLTGNVEKETYSLQ